MPKNEITSEQYEKAYEIAKKVHEGQLNIKDGESFLSEQYGMDNSSASMYIHSINLMMDGKEYARTMKIEATEYVFERIKNDFGMEKLKRAILATQQHAEYYYRKKGHRLRSIEQLCAKWQKMHNFDSDRTCFFAENENVMKSPQSNVELQMCGRLEGAKILAPLHTYYERNPKNRAICLRIKGYKCVVCEFDFMESYGERGKEFIHVHHVIPLSEIDEEHIVDPTKDLCPVCPNCHAMLHRGELITIEELQAIMKTQTTIVEQHRSQPK